MCAINPKRQRTFTLTVYTAHDMTEEHWQELTIHKALNVEQLLNADGRARWHLTEKEAGE